MTELLKDSDEENKINLNSLPLDCLIIVYSCKVLSYHTKHPIFSTSYQHQLYGS